MIPYFYPKDLPSSERLPYYSRFFNTVEIDSSFYGLPSERNSLLFSKRTPDDFVIHFKAFRLMTMHPTPLNSLGKTLRSYLPSYFSEEKIFRFVSEELKQACFKMFWLALLPLKFSNKLGYILFQFPPWFKKSDENCAYLYEIRKLLPEAKIAVEFRNGTWFLKNELTDTLSMLSELSFTHVIVDEPQVGIYGSVPSVFELTSNDAYVRFHGRNKENWLKKGAKVQEKFKYLYSEEELRPFVKEMFGLKERAEKIYVLFNNCFAYYALKNAKMFAEMVGALEEKEPLKLINSDEQNLQLF